MFVLICGFIVAYSKHGSRVQHKLLIRTVNKFTVVPKDMYGGEGGEQYQNHLMCYAVLSNAKLLLYPSCLQNFPLGMVASVW